MADLQYIQPVAPILPKADQGIAEMNAQQGQAGLAAFVAYNNHRNQMQLEEKRLQQAAVHDQQSFGLEREKMAQDFQLRTRQMGLAEAARRVSARNEDWKLKQATGLANALAENPYEPGTKEYHQNTLQAIAKYRGGASNAVVAQLLRDSAIVHDGANEVGAGVQSQLDALGIPREDADITVQTDEKGRTKYKVVAKHGKAASDAPANQYYSPQALLADNPGAHYRQDPKTGGWYVTSGPTAARDKKKTTMLAPEVGILAPQDSSATDTKPKMKKGGFYGDEGGDVVRVNTGKTVKGEPVYEVMTKQEYEARGGKLAPAKPAAVTASATPTPTPRATPTPADTSYAGNKTVGLPLPDGSILHVGEIFNGKKWNGGDPGLPGSWE